eukprot:CAMPEP_0184478318 /NCGR_PEP_ID=MMETSP0113_2-20130426/379_1 /TAXON_ID=91329 /ORGANISM="Norrisiella sphaerica, Strain BC52" /LENGTH=863 /DNA_ID=CAMNT_0026856069 /DNA_START=52 /DNA_END=2643 /DNA_ORIENTATION=-
MHKQDKAFRALARHDCTKEQLRTGIGPGGVDARNTRGRTALMEAIPVDHHSNEPIDQGTMDRISALLDMKAGVNLKDNSGNSALTRAVQSSDKELVQLLLRRGASTQTVTEHGDFLKSEIYQKETREWIHYVESTCNRSRESKSLIKLIEPMGDTENESLGRYEIKLKSVCVPAERIAECIWKAFFSSRVKLKQLTENIFSFLELSRRTRRLSAKRMTHYFEPSPMNQLWEQCAKKEGEDMKRFVYLVFRNLFRSGLDEITGQILSSPLGAFGSPAAVVLDQVLKFLHTNIGGRTKLEGSFAHFFLPTVTERLNQEFDFGTILSDVSEEIRSVMKTPASINRKAAQIFMESGGSEYCIQVLNRGLIQKPNSAVKKEVQFRSGNAHERHGFCALVPFWNFLKGGMRSACVESNEILTKNLHSLVTALVEEVETSAEWGMTTYADCLLNVYYTISVLLNHGADPMGGGKHSSTWESLLKAIRCLPKLVWNLDAKKLTFPAVSSILNPSIIWFDNRLTCIAIQKLARFPDRVARTVAEYNFGFSAPAEYMDPRGLETTQALWSYASSTGKSFQMKFYSSGEEGSRASEEANRFGGFIGFGADFWRAAASASEWEQLWRKPKLDFTLISVLEKMRVQKLRRNCVSSSQSQNAPQYQLAVVGAAGAGKSSVTLRLVTDCFLQNNDRSEEVYRTCLTVDEKMVVLDVLDSSTEMISYRANISRDVDRVGFLILYDITDEESFDAARLYPDTIRGFLDLKKMPVNKMPVNVVLVGNKCDLEEDREVSRAKGEALASEWDCPFFEVSAKMPTNVLVCFSALVKEIRQTKKNQATLKRNAYGQAKNNQDPDRGLISPKRRCRKDQTDRPFER